MSVWCNFITKSIDHEKGAINLGVALTCVHVCDKLLYNFSDINIHTLYR